MNILGIRLDLTKFEKTIKEMEKHIKSTDDIHKKMIDELSKPKKGDDNVRYIG